MTSTTSRTPAKPGSTTPNLTPAMIRSGKGIAADTDALLTLTAEAKRAADKATSGSMWLGALAAHRVLTMTGSVPAKEFAARTGFAESYVSRLRRIGAFVVDHGVGKGTEAFTFLCVNGSAKEVGEALKSEDPKAALSKVIADRKAAKVAAGSARPPAPVEAPAAEADKGDAPVVETLTVARLLDLLDAASKTADRETWATIESRLAAIVDREVTVRSHVTVKGETA